MTSWSNVHLLYVQQLLVGQSRTPQTARPQEMPKPLNHVGNLDNGKRCLEQASNHLSSAGKVFCHLLCIFAARFCSCVPTEYEIVFSKLSLEYHAALVDKIHDKLTLAALLCCDIFSKRLETMKRLIATLNSQSITRLCRLSHKVVHQDSSHSFLFLEKISLTMSVFVRSCKSLPHARYGVF